MTIPLSLYIHIPWCVKKCPYCDFNSHAVKGTLPQEEYVTALIADLMLDLELVQGRQLQSIFFGGGTPSLLAPHLLERLLNKVASLIPFSPNIEITLETNPGTVEHYNFSDYKQAGINRISLGAQSFNNDKLQALGRIHNKDEILDAIAKIHAIGFKSFNLDLMYGLPQQNLEEALFDLQTAIDCAPPHISWYQLTLEPNTVFYKYPPKLPHDDLTWEMQTQGQALLAKHGFLQYEVSAYAKPEHQSQHNLNYWEFGDYLGIGAGAHGKITNLVNNTIQRTWKNRNPKDYLDPNLQFLAGNKLLPAHELPGEYMLNRLRLFKDLNLRDYELVTGLSRNTLAQSIMDARLKELLQVDGDILQVTELGKRFLNDLMQIFLRDEFENVA